MLEPARLFPAVADHVNRVVKAHFGDDQLGRCVSATGTSIEVHLRLGFTAAPLSVELQAVDPNLADFLENGYSSAAQFSWASLGDLSKGPALENGAWRGHLVTASSSMILDPMVEQTRRLGCAEADRVVVFTFDEVFLALKTKEYFLHRPDTHGPAYAYRPSPENNHFKTFESWSNLTLHSRLADDVVDAVWSDPRVATNIQTSRVLDFGL